MARKKKQWKKRHNKYTHKGRGYFSDNDYNTFFMIISDMARNDKEVAFLIGTILLTLAGIPSTKQQKIWKN